MILKEVLLVLKQNLQVLDSPRVGQSKIRLDDIIQHQKKRKRDRRSTLSEQLVSGTYSPKNSAKLN